MTDHDTYEDDVDLESLEGRPRSWAILRLLSGYRRRTLSWSGARIVRY